MLTPEQEKWIESLSDKTITIIPYDPRAGELFIKIKERIESVLGSKVIVEHVGASSLGISGQDEVDVSIVAKKEDFEVYIKKLEPLFGPPRSRYPDRARFDVREEGKKIDLKIVDKNHPNYIESKKFEEYLKQHPETLERYRALKEECDGLTTKEYYRKKAGFINEILDMQ